MLAGLVIASPPALANEGGANEMARAMPAAPDGPGPMAAQPAHQPMVVVRMRGKDRCIRRCPEWIMAQGEITAETPRRFREVLRQAGSIRLPVVLDSEGGDVDAALEIGRMIRARGLTTIIGRSEVQGCAPRDAACNKDRPPARAYEGFVVTPGACAGSCLLLLAAGKERVGYWIAEAAFPALESFRSRKIGSDAAEMIAGYLADMGISPGLVPRLRRSSLPLDRAEILHFGLSTGRQRVEDFTGTSICMRQRPAPNCLLVAAPPRSVAVSDLPARSEAARSEAVPKRTARKQTARPAARVIIWGAIEDM